MTLKPAIFEDGAAARDERDAVAAAARGDSAAFEELYDRHAQGIYNMVLRSVREPRAAEDLCQEIWMKAHRELPRLREPAAFSLWLYRIAAKRCIDAARRRGRRPAAEQITDDVAERGDGPEAAALRHEDGRLVWEALAALPPKQHLALSLREVEGRSYQEIASVLRMSVTAVGLCLLRGRRSFGRTYGRMSDSAMIERCSSARTTMAALIDGEANEVQRRGVLAHVEACRTCEGDLTVMRRASRGYAALALAPVPALLSARILSHTAAAAGVAGGSAGVGKIVAGLVAQAKPLALAVTAGGGLTAAALLTPGPPPGAPLAPPTAHHGGAAQIAPAMPGAAGAGGGVQPYQNITAPAGVSIPQLLPAPTMPALPIGPAGTAVTSGIAALTAPLATTVARTLPVPTVTVTVIAVPSVQSLSPPGVTVPPLHLP
ncbi:MAG TPA: sigma-70 family RNA polymerase sigma factor [Dehalococcoidia bacterium]|nr:sigma-70 family RNA polymerase sigma factor [Dehalococcoidia bacterium]